MWNRVVGIGILGFAVFCVGCKPEEERQKDAELAAQREAEAKRQAELPPMADQVAKPGVGVRGDSLESISDDDPRNLIVGPAKAYFRVKEQITFMALEKRLREYNALKGRDPKTHEEYMKEVVQEIKLPELPKGMVYRYHPDTSELWVESDKKGQ